MQALVTPNQYFIMPVLPKEVAIMAQQRSKVNRNNLVIPLSLSMNMAK